MENNNKESFTLLGMSDSGSDSGSIPEFVAPRKKKVRRRVRGSSGHRVRYREPCTCNARTVGLSLAATLLLCWLIVLSWLAVVLHNELKRLDANVNNVVAGSQGVTDALQKYHSLSRGLQKNQTVLYAKLEVTPMQYTLHELQEKLKAAPELVNVPQNLKDLKENVASFGSQIRDFNTTVTELKNQNSQLLEKTNMLVKNITNTEQTVEMLLNASQQNHGTSAAYGEETKAILSLTNQLSQNITRVNETLSNKFQWIDDEQKKDKKDLEELQELGQSISARVTTLEGECPKSSAKITALQQQIDNITHLVMSDEGQLRDLNNRFVLFQSNNSQLREMVNNMHEAISQLSSQMSTSPATPNGEVP
ncbi:Uncharacterized protein GBIM_08369 [Gryllus bimaculatus]|nr:Uncharacterized protein GBIM_08369 [Gryllus bimaculatus]